MTLAPVAYLPWLPPEEFNIMTDEDGRRHYRHKDGPWRVSSTTVLDIIAKRLEKWAAESEREKYNLAIAEAVLEPCAPEFLLSRVQEKVGQRLVYTTLRDTAANLGTSVHAAVRAFLVCELSGGAPPIPKLSPEALVSFSTFVSWWRSEGLTPIRMEQPIVEPEWNYAGTLDIFAERKDGSRGIVDLKNSKWISNGHHYQVASYMRGARRHDDVQWGVIAKMPKSGRPLEIKKLGQGMWGGDQTEAECMEGFYHALHLWRCENRRAA